MPKILNQSDLQGHAGLFLKRFPPGSPSGLKEFNLALPPIPGLLLPVDKGWDERGPWLAFPKMAGSLKERKLTKPELLAMMRRLLDVLEPLHARFTHRDLSPGNILFDEAGLAWLSDLGCVLENGKTPDIPKDGLGTPAHAAPEQLLGGPADPRADLYSLGSLCYECLSGAPPFGTDAPERIGARKLRERPRPLHPLVDAMLEADPARRPGIQEIRSRLETL